MKLLAICATKNRHTHLEKLVRCFLEQDYEGDATLLIYNNGLNTLEIDDNSPSNRRIILVNNYIDKETKKPYTNLGSIYNDILSYVPEDIDVVTHMDDDDIYLPSHFRLGVEGLEKGGLLAYKPLHSYYLDSRGLHLANNVMEPSIFVMYNHLKEHGYNKTNVDIHHKWLRPLVDSKQISVDKEGQATFIYDWSGKIPTFKTSGFGNVDIVFEMYASRSRDLGDGKITPMEQSNYYSLLKTILNHG